VPILRAISLDFYLLLPWVSTQHERGAIRREPEAVSGIFWGPIVGTAPSGLAFIPWCKLGQDLAPLWLHLISRVREKRGCGSPRLPHQAAGFEDRGVGRLGWFLKKRGWFVAGGVTSPSPISPIRRRTGPFGDKQFSPCYYHPYPSLGETGDARLGIGSSSSPTRIELLRQSEHGELASRQLMPAKSLAQWVEDTVRGPSWRIQRRGFANCGPFRCGVQGSVSTTFLSEFQSKLTYREYYTSVDRERLMSH